MTYYNDWKRKQYYHWEVNDLYEVSSKLRELNDRLNRKLEPEDLDYYLDDYSLTEELNQRINKKVRALARELREIKEQLNFIETLIRQRKDLMPKDALMW